MCVRPSTSFGNQTPIVHTGLRRTPKSLGKMAFLSVDWSKLRRASAHPGGANIIPLKSQP